MGDFVSHITANRGCGKERSLLDVPHAGSTKVIFLATAPEYPRQTDVSLALIGPPTSARCSIASGRSISVNGVAGGEIL